MRPWLAARRVVTARRYPDSGRKPNINPRRAAIDVDVSLHRITRTYDLPLPVLTGGPLFEHVIVIHLPNPRPAGDGPLGPGFRLRVDE